jgi:hypothetical protein
MSPGLSSPPSQKDLELWCSRHLGAAPAEVVFEEQHLSFVTGLRLTMAGR